MVALDCDIELPVPIDDLRISPNYPELIGQMEKCEFKSLLQEVKDEAAKVVPPTSVMQAELKL
jgi:DNA polymerase-1